ncbi:MAG TPA: hypothetical protein VGC13_06475 [Longimicrobium sp.]|jgi:alpha-tubulin suppressor-like RCC1 family protein|uniref:RCC1 domain-containing protein n=1 Tax=Longimicrobium sp. TaxID=2029185 RepID=UPI002ED8A219
MFFRTPSASRIAAVAALALGACERDPTGSRGDPIASVAVANDAPVVCALTTEGAAYCWGGNNFHGNLGTGSIDTGETYHTTPERVAGGVRFTTISAGPTYTCATTAGAKLYCWGEYPGPVGFGKVPAPREIAGVRFAEVTAMGWGFGPCGLSPEGQAACAAFDASGFAPVAPGQAFSAFTRSLSFVDAGGNSSRTYLHQCGLREGMVLCWGENWYGELGNGARTPVGSLEPVASPAPVAGSTRFTSVGTGMNHACALATDATAWCWGRGLYGMLGTGGTADSPAPAQVAGGLRLARLSVGKFHACGVAIDGAAYCWGLNTHGALGAGTAVEFSATPVQVAGGLRWKQVSAGEYTSCGVTDDDGVYCWGRNESGQLGNGSRTASPVPVRVAFPL